MGEQEDKPPQRLEEMLRSWGLGQAVRDAKPAPWRRPKADQAPKRPAGHVALLRWGPPSIAAALFLAAAWLFIQANVTHGPARSGDASQLATRESPLTTRQAPPDTQPAGAAEELAKLKEAHAAELKALQATHAGELQNVTQKLRDDFEAARLKLTAQAEEANARIAALQEAATAGDKGIELLKKEIAGLQDLLAAAKKDASEAAKDLAKTHDELQDARKRQTAAVAELARQQQMHKEGLVALQAARAELADIRTQHQMMLDDFQRIYLAAAGAGERSLGARQKAARGARVVERCTMLRRSVPSDLAAMLDAMEVVFTRLDMLDAHDPRAAEAFAALLRGSDLPARLDAALGRGDAAPLVRSLLFEAKLILQGAEHGT